MENQIEQNKTKWISTTKQYMTETKTTFGQYKKMMKIWDDTKWYEELEQKTSIETI